MALKEQLETCESLRRQEVIQFESTLTVRRVLFALLLQRKSETTWFPCDDWCCGQTLKLQQGREIEKLETLLVQCESQRAFAVEKAQSQVQAMQVRW
jgi:hypothetical protein